MRIFKLSFLALLVAFTLVTAFLFYKKDKAPLNEIKLAREGITVAKMNQAEAYAPNILKNSVSMYDSAMYYWDFENERFFLFRDYDKVRSFADLSIKGSQSATEKAMLKSKNLKSEIGNDIKVLDARVASCKAKYDSLPASYMLAKFTKGQIRLNEGKIAYKNGDLVEAKNKISEAKILINTYNAEAEKLVADYFKNYKRWKTDVENAIHRSKVEKTYVVVVEKVSRKLYLYHNGKLDDTFQIEMGKNWMGDKNHQGDFSTPEGNYKITDKKEKGRTKFYKALLLNYPNEEDKKRFAENKKKGLIKGNKSIGGLIEIHGGGGQGADWTDGCVALTNDDMDDLYRKVKVNTGVVIVGSLKTMDDFLK